ncbi:hypothetical protein J6590_028572 [Homalodisca vitripennis]|nr:hypothetical protein J6590_028572 [Homalodisca vitripennis]
MKKTVYGMILTHRRGQSELLGVRPQHYSRVTITITCVGRTSKAIPAHCQRVNKGDETLATAPGPCPIQNNCDGILLTDKQRGRDFSDGSRTMSYPEQLRRYTPNG